MKHLILLAGAAALASTAPALAKPGKGHGPHANHAYGVDGPMGYGAGGCPPGLRNKGCMPPGQAKKLAVGQRFLGSYGSPYGYNQIPYDLRQQYGFDPYSRYYYGQGSLYRVDPKTMLVQQVVSALLR